MEDRTKRDANGAPPRTGWARMVVELHVNDLAGSLSFWRDVLGFRTAFERAEERFVYLEHAQGHQIMLCQRHGRFETGPLDHPLGQGAMLQIYLEDIAPVLQTLTARNWPIFLDPERYGAERATGRADRERFSCKTRTDIWSWWLTTLAKDRSAIGEHQPGFVPTAQ